MKRIVARKRLCEGCGKEKANVSKVYGLCRTCRGFEVKAIGRNPNKETK